VKGGKRCPLKYTRAILNAIHDGSLANVDYETLEIFNLQVPVSCPGVPTELLNPAKSGQRTAEEFHSEISELANLFIENFEHYRSQASPEIIVHHDLRND
jgi:phosphoenolpyruvate carboxykinase (ATP)